MRNRVWWLALTPLLLAACAGPVDVEASYARELGTAQEVLYQAQEGVSAAERDYVTDLASAREWNVHVFGIPASGWVAILIFASILLFIGLIFLSLWARESLEDRRRKASALALAKEETRQAELAAQKAEWDSVARYVPPAASTDKKARTTG